MRRYLRNYLIFAGIGFFIFVCIALDGLFSGGMIFIGDFGKTWLSVFLAGLFIFQQLAVFPVGIAYLANNKDTQAKGLILFYIIVLAILFLIFWVPILIILVGVFSPH
jgi:hypothetical protein